MGAMARHVLQVKRKNSTSCKPPEARLTVVGSVASKFGPREVATGCTSDEAAVDKGAVGVAATAGTELGVKLRSRTCLTVAAVAVAGAHAASSTANRTRLVPSADEKGRKRSFFISLLYFSVYSTFVT